MCAAPVIRGAKKMTHEKHQCMRDRLLEACRSQLTSSRENVVARLRRRQQTPRAFLRVLVQQEQRRMTPAGSRVAKLPDDELAQDDEVAMDEASASQERSSSNHAGASCDPEEEDADEGLTEDEYLDLMLRLEEDLNNVMMQQETEALKQLEIVERMENEDLEHLTWLQSSSDDDDDGDDARDDSQDVDSLDGPSSFRRHAVLRPTELSCPVCGAGRVLRRGSVLRCTRFGDSSGISCSFRIDTSGGLGAESLEESLSRATGAHAAQCPSRATLRVEGPPGAETLQLTCATCGFLDIVV